MSNDPAITQSGPAEEIWHDVDALIHEIARLSREDVSIHDFYSALVDRAVEALEASAGAVWLFGSTVRLQVEYQHGMRRLGLDGDGEAAVSHGRLVEAVARSRASRTVAPHSGSHAAGAPGNPTEHLLLLCPITLDGEAVGVLEIFQRPDTSRSAQQGFMRFLAALCELAGEFHSNRQLRQMQERSTLWGQFQQFAERLHGSLNLQSTAYVLANEGRRLIGCDRLSVAVRSGSKYRLRAVSGLDTVDRRANAVRRLETLIRAVTRTGEPLWYTGDTSGLPPQIDTPLNEYLDESHSRMLAVIPLFEEEAEQPPTRRRQPDAVIVVEQFDTSQIADATKQRITAVCRQSSPALRNALEHQSIPFLPVMKLLRAMLWCFGLKQLPKTMAALILLVGTVLFLVLYPADFEIGGTAELQPEIRRDVFAASDGVVSELLVEQKNEVAAGDVVVRLRNSDLDFKLSELLGDIQTTQKELDTVQVTLRSTNPNDPKEQLQYNQSAAREVELKAKLNSLEQQRVILRLQVADLDIRSPIAGEVLTWDLQKTLQARPVKRGQVLMTVADVKGPWVVEIKVADDHINHVLAARRKFGKELKVAFRLAADPGVTHVGEVQSVAETTEPDETDGPIVRVIVRFDKKQITQLRPGASVVPRIYCGRRSIGYVWFHELIEAIETRLLF